MVFTEFKNVFLFRYTLFENHRFKIRLHFRNRYPARRDRYVNRQADRQLILLRPGQNQAPSRSRCFTSKISLFLCKIDTWFTAKIQGSRAQIPLIL